jgi:hypothetical protein
MPPRSTDPRPRKGPRWRYAALAALLATATHGFARNASQPFEVQVSLVAAPATATCSESTTPGPTTQVSIECGQSKAAPGTSHVLLHVFRADDWVGSVDGRMATGTVTSWRVVRLAQREYLEMTVGW